MKFCDKCGKEIMDQAVVCPNCGCAVKKEKEVTKLPSYDDCVNGAMTTNIIAIVVLLVGVVCALFVNVWVGVVLCLATEFIAIVPNSKLQKAFKSNFKGSDKNELKNQMKQCQKELKSKYPAYKFSFVLAFIALACVIVFALLGSALGL